MNTLTQTLLEATSLDPENRRKAETQLSEWEINPSFYSSLLQLFCNTQLEMKIRSLSIIHLKNGIDKYWRKSAKNGIHADEKMLIRSKLIECFQFLQEKPLYTQHALVISKIARHDYPQDWPDVLNQITHIIMHCQTVNQKVHSLYTLHLIVKGLCSKTLASSRKNLQEITPDLFKFTSSLFYQYTQDFFSKESTSEFEALEVSLGLSMMSLKSLRRLLVYGFVDFTQSQEAMQLFTSLVPCLKRFLHFRKRSDIVTCSTLFEKITKMIKLMGKITLDLQKQNIATFVLASQSVEIVEFYWKLLESYESLKEDPMMDAILIQAISILRNLIKNSDFSVVNPCKILFLCSYSLLKASEAKEKLNQAKSFLDSHILVPEFLSSCLSLLVSKYLLLSSEELATWESDPEIFIEEEGADHWEYNVRMSAGKLVTELVQKNRSATSPILVQMLESSFSPNFSILTRDAVLTALGLCAHDLYDYVDFDSLLTRSLIPMIQTESSSTVFKLIKRRIIWLIGQWISIKISSESRSVIYPLLLNMLKEDDLVVRLTSITTLRLCIDDFDFETPIFLPWLSDSIHHCVGLIPDVEEMESKQLIVQCLCVIVQRMEQQVIPFVPQLISAISNLWQMSEGQFMFRGSIVDILSKLVVSLGSESDKISNVCLSVIQCALNPSDVSAIFKRKYQHYSHRIFISLKMD